MRYHGGITNVSYSWTIPFEIQLVEIVAASTVWVTMVVAVMAAVVVTVLIVGAVGNMRAKLLPIEVCDGGAIELLPGVVTAVVVALEFVVSV